MISEMIYWLVKLVYGTLYPAYTSYKAVKTRSVKEYVKWMMYWIIFACFTCVETFTDIFISWLPFYYEMKILFLFWLLSPATKGSSFLYTKFLHPEVAKREKEIDTYIAKATDQGYSAIGSLVSKGFEYGTNVVLATALKSQTEIADHLRKSHSMGDLPVDTSQDCEQEEIKPELNDMADDYALTIERGREMSTQEGKAANDKKNKARRRRAQTLNEDMGFCIVDEPEGEVAAKGSRKASHDDTLPREKIRTRSSSRKK